MEVLLFFGLHIPIQLQWYCLIRPIIRYLLVLFLVLVLVIVIVIVIVYLLPLTVSQFIVPKVLILSHLSSLVLPLSLLAYPLEYLHSHRFIPLPTTTPPGSILLHSLWQSIQLLRAIQQLLIQLQWYLIQFCRSGSGSDYGSFVFELLPSDDVHQLIIIFGLWLFRSVADS